MSDAQARALIGCKISLDDLWEEVEEKPCYHDYGPGANFCSLCGVSTQPKRKWIKKYGEEAGVGWDDPFAYDAVVPLETFSNMFVHIVYGVGGNIFAGIRYAESEWDGSFGYVALSEYDYQYGMAKAALQELGLWDADSFGLHAILYWSI